MKIIKISYKDIKSNLKKNVKIMVIILSICMIMGCIIGVVDASHYSPIKYSNMQMQRGLNLNEIKRDGAYYYNAFMSLKEQVAYLNAYVECLERIEFSEESKEIIAAFTDTMSGYQKTYNAAINFYYNEAPYIPEEKNNTLKFYEDSIKELERNKEKQEIKLEYEKKNRDAIVDYIVKIQERIELFQEHHNLVQSRSDDVAEVIANEADNILNINYQEINNIITTFNSSISAIEKNDCYEIEYCKRFFYDYTVETDLLITGALKKEIVLNDKKGQAIIYAKSIEGVDIIEERFIAIFMFFTLFGAVISLLIGGFFNNADKKQVQNKE